MDVLKKLPIKLYDEKFSTNKTKYIFQCFLATLSVMFALVFLNAFTNAVVIASIGATSFTAFSMPHRENSKARYVIGGYMVGILMGSVCFFMSQSHLFMLSPSSEIYLDEVFGALAVGLTMFLMIIADLEHPPAAGLALGLVLREWSFRTLVVTVLAITFIVVFRRLLKKHLIDLL